MHLKILTSVLALVLVSVSGFGQYKYVQKLGNLGTVSFPGTPKIKEQKDLKMYFVNYNQVFYMAQCSNVSGGLIQLFKKNSLDSLYEGYISGMVKATNGKVFYKHKEKISGHDGIEFGYSAKFNGQQTYRYHHAVAINDTLLMCGIWAADSLSKDDENLAAFFKGFKPKNKQQFDNESGSRAAYKVGTAIGYILAVGLMIGVGVLFIFLIRKIAMRK